MLEGIYIIRSGMIGVVCHWNLVFKVQRSLDIPAIQLQDMQRPLSVAERKHWGAITAATVVGVLLHCTTSGTALTCDIAQPRISTHGSVPL